MVEALPKLNAPGRFRDPCQTVLDYVTLRHEVAENECPYSKPMRGWLNQLRQAEIK